MKNNLVHSLFIASMLLLFSCNMREKNLPHPSSAPVTNKNIPLTQTLTPGQVHNLIVEDYIAQYGIVPDNQITQAEVETVCDRIAQIAEDENLLVNITAADLSDKLVDMYITSGAFVNGVLKSSDDLTIASINGVSNLDLKNAYSQIRTMAIQGDPNFVANSTLILNSLTSLSPSEQNEVNGFKSVLSSSFNLWSNPSYLPTQGGTGTTRVVNADADGYSAGYREGWTSSGDQYFADFVGSAWGSSRSLFARFNP